MPAVGAKRQWLHPDHRGKIERTVEMRKQRAAAGRLPFQRNRSAKCGGIDR